MTTFSPYNPSSISESISRDEKNQPSLQISYCQCYKKILICSQVFSILISATLLNLINTFVSCEEASQSSITADRINLRPPRVHNDTQFLHTGCVHRRMLNLISFKLHVWFWPLFISISQIHFCQRFVLIIKHIFNILKAKF